MPYLKEMSQATREALPARDFVFPETRRYPIQNAEQAMTALTYTTWPQNKKDAPAVRAAVFKRYPALRSRFLDGKFAKPKRKRRKRKRPQTESGFGSLGDLEHISERLAGVQSIVAEAESIRHHDPQSVAAMFVKEDFSSDKKVAQAFGRDAAQKVMSMVHGSGITLRPGARKTLENDLAYQIAESVLSLMEGQ